MIQRLYTILKYTTLFFAPCIAFAGNPDRQGESGANELLINPWARSAGIHSLNTSSVTGIEAMRLNIAGLSRIKRIEVGGSNTRLYQGSGLGMTEAAFASKVGKNGAFGLTFASMNFGKIPVTSTLQPEGTGEVFSPNFFHIGIGYSLIYANKISVGILVRGISESITSATAFGFAIDAGVQYVTGPQDNFRLGIALRNTGSPMKFGGEGLSVQNANTENTELEYVLTYDGRAEDFELPSLLSIGISYDFYINKEQKTFVRGLGNFTSNAFSKDIIGAGAELVFRDRFMIRAAYKINYGKSSASIGDELYTGFAAGASLTVPVSKDGAQTVTLDYGYRPTNPFRGSHSMAIKMNI